MHIDPNGYDNELEFPIEVSSDPYSERTVYEVERKTFKNRRKHEKTGANNFFDDENEQI